MNGWLRGAIATIIVGASFPVSQALVGYPYAAGQSIRYALGALVLTAILRGRLGKPTPREFALLFAVAAVGMTGFNLAILAAVDRIGATNVGVLVGASPVILALAARNRAVLGPALAVVIGATIVNGADSNLNSTGLLIALGALAAEVGFTLLAAPLLPRLGPTRTAAWAAWIATVQLAVIHPQPPDADAHRGRSDPLPRAALHRPRLRALVRRRPAPRRRPRRPARRPDAGCRGHRRRPA